MLNYTTTLEKVNEKSLELIAIAKTYDRILWSCNQKSAFPRNRRLVPGEWIERNLYALLETLVYFPAQVGSRSTPAKARKPIRFQRDSFRTTPISRTMSSGSVKTEHERLQTGNIAAAIGVLRTAWKTSEPSGIWRTSEKTCRARR
jgi:hypothetical protein